MWKPGSPQNINQGTNIRSRERFIAGLLYTGNGAFVFNILPIVNVLHVYIWSEVCPLIRGERL